MRLITLHGTSLNRSNNWQEKLQSLYIVGIVGLIVLSKPAVSVETFASYFHWQHWHLISGLAVGAALVAWQALIYRRIVSWIFPGTFEREIGFIRDERKKIPVAIQYVENIFIGFIEELLHRAILIPLCGFTVALILFTAPHLARSIKGQIMVYGNVLVCGFVLSVLFIATGSLWPGIVAHILHNALIDHLFRRGYP